MTSFFVGPCKVSKESVTVIAEAGVNHLGRMDFAESLIASASRAGADIIKFQTYKAEKLTTKDAPRFWSWEGERVPDGTQYDSYSRLDSFEMPEYRALVKMCQKYDIGFMSTPFDEQSLAMLVSLGMQAIKIASCDITNFPLLQASACTGLPVMLSTGGSSLEEIKSAVQVLQENGNKDLILMHCTLCYPTMDEDANLSAIPDLEQNFPDAIIGLSDHTLGVTVPAASVALGVRVIEKHFTFDKSLPDSADHWLSVNEAELSVLVNGAKSVMKALGSGGKRVLECEHLARKNARRSLVLNRDLPAGHTILTDDISAKRPGTGIPPSDFSRVLGRKTRHSLVRDELLTWDALS